MKSLLSSSQHVKTELNMGVLRIELNRPERKNALTSEMYIALVEALEFADRTSEVRVVLLHGQPDIFTSGNDLSDFQRKSAFNDDYAGYHFVRAISSALKPIVVAVNGACVGVGATLLLHCDLIYVGEGATFTMPFVNLGLCPEAGSSFLLPFAAGHARASELLLLGHSFDATRAEECGIISGIFPDSEVLAHAKRSALEIAKKPPAAVRLTKALLRRGITAQLDDALREETREFQQRLISPEAGEAFSAFMEKRKPDFSDFK